MLPNTYVIQEGLNDDEFVKFEMQFYELQAIDNLEKEENKQNYKKNF